MSTEQSTPDPGVEESRRLINLTEKAADQFHERVKQYQAKLDSTWCKVSESLVNSDRHSTDKDILKQTHSSICLLYAEYRLAGREYVTFLERSRSNEGKKLLTEYSVNDSHCDNQVNAVLKSIEEAQTQIELETKSKSSKAASIRSSIRSTTSSAAIKAKVRAEAAKVRIVYAEREAELRKQEAAVREEEALSTARAERKRMEIHADIQVLHEHKLCAEAVAEEETWEANSDNGDKFSVISEHKLPNFIEKSSDRTRRFIEEQSIRPEPQIDIGYDMTCKEQPRIDMKIFEPECVTQKQHFEPHQTHMNPQAPEFAPLSTTIATEISRFLVKKDLLFSRLTLFTDEAEKYVAWKAGFLQVTKEMGVSNIEELDLLIKWLGPESRKHAISIKAANIEDPARGLIKIWQRLNERYGSPEMVEAALKRKLAEFPKLSTKDHKKLYELSDLLSEVEPTMENDSYRTVLGYFNSSTGVNPIVQKLPYHLQGKWTDRATKYMKQHRVTYPPFHVFCQYVHDMSAMLNNPSFVYEDKTVKTTRSDRYSKPSDIVKPSVFRSYKTEVEKPKVNSAVDQAETCTYHGTTGHTINKCKTFRCKPFNVRKKFFRDKNICFKCALGSDHTAKLCKAVVKCMVCGLDTHPTALHFYGGEGHASSNNNNEQNEVPISSACTNVCGDETSIGKSCAKVVLVTVYAKDKPDKKKKMYALIDDQSNRSLAKPEFFDEFEDDYSEIPYTLSSCAGVINTSGRRTTHASFVVSSIDETSSLYLPALTECNQIPNVREEIPTRNSARHHAHLKDIADNIPELDNASEILLLLGRDLTEAHHVLEQRTGPRGSPYAHKLYLGWVVIGETCLGKIHQPRVNVKKTFVHKDGRCSIFPECKNQFNMKETFKEAESNGHNENDIGSRVFQVTAKDEKLAMSMEEKDFMKMMNSEFKKDSDGNWTAPLPFQSTRPRLPNNRNMALNRTRNLVASLNRNPTKQKHFIQFMQKMLDTGHAEIAAPLTSDTECWYLPIFGIYHRKKVDQIRVVFDSSANYMGFSLNGVLMTGPDLTNNLLGILMRFRREPVAVSADIQQMFYQFRVDEKDRDYLRFFWFKDNNPEMALQEYRMCVHVFGNSPSPAIATFGLHQSAKTVEELYGSDVTEFVLQDFYVDDGLTSLQSVHETIDLMQRTQKALASGGNLKLHKITSNSREVMNVFPKEDLANDLKDLDIGHEGLPTQRSLGLNWDLDSDQFAFIISDEAKPCTRRGILSTLNSLFDPLGFISPVVVHGRIIQRDLTAGSPDWDEPLPKDASDEWSNWCASLMCLETLKVPRTYLEGSLSATVQQEVHVFSDASEKAIAAVAYLKTADANGEVNVGFIIGKSKVSPKHGHTIPRLELCAAVMAVELADVILEHLRMPVENMRFYTDSRVVLGYIHNGVRRFYVYVENRVSRILKLTRPDQWSFISTKDNPADLGTRPTPAGSLQNSMWLLGPSFLHSENFDIEKTYDLETPVDDPEIRPEIHCLKTNVDSRETISTNGFETFSRWERLVNAIVVWKRFARRVRNRRRETRIPDDDVHTENIELQTFAESLIIMSVQTEVYAKEIECIQGGRPIPKNSSMISLNPYIDNEGILRVGGRLRNADLTVIERNPILLPGNHCVSRLLVRYYHQRNKHHGRQITEGGIREAGFWITGVKRVIASVIRQCMKCQKLRGRLGYQRMADLPPDRLTSGPPFTSVGLDCFGPWQVTSRRTRGGQAHSKRWAVMFTCLTSRAVHIEVVEEMSSSSFINALRRFTSIRGKAKIYRSDRGTNFIGALDDLGVNISDGVKRYLDHEGSIWILNPPHSSHRGGVWERMIGVTRRILDSLLLDLPGGGLTHEVLTTFMAEVSAIVNSRPLVSVSTDSCAPTPLSPSLLLTQKSDCIVDVVLPEDIKDMYRAQWKRVQILAEQFWKRWRSEFIQTLQVRRKWTDEQRELQCGDVVLLRDKQVARNDWPMALIESVVPSDDGYVRTAVVRTVGTNGNLTTYERPVNEMVLLIPS